MSYDYEQTHKNILESAKKQFKKKGFRDASIRNICKDAGVTNGAFYAHFKSKEDLFDCIVKPGIDGLLQMYAGEEEQYVEVNSAEEVVKAFDGAYASSKKLIDYLFENRETFLLIFESGGGTVYESFAEELIQTEADNSLYFFEKCKPYVNNKDSISENLVRMTASYIIDTVFYGLKQGMDLDRIHREAMLMSEFCTAGYRKLLGI